MRSKRKSERMLFRALMSGRQINPKVLKRTKDERKKKMGMYDKKGSFEEATSQATPSHDPFDRVGSAETSERSNYPLPGVYPMLYCDQLKMVTSRLSGDSIFVAEFDILESDVQARPKGTSLSWLCNLRHLPSPGNVREFLAVLNGVMVDEVDAEGARFACSKENPSHGRLIRLEATEVETKKGNPFTRCKWIPIPDEVQNNAKQLRIDAGYPAF